MTVFWIIVGTLCLITLWLLWRPLHRHSALKMESVQQRNIAIAHERALEIDSAFETGEISTEERDQARQDLEMALADELATSSELKDQFSQAPLAGSLIVLLLVPLLALGVYTSTTTYQPDTVDLRELAADGKAPSLDEVIGKLEEAVDANPEDQQGLYLLAQSYSRLGRFPEAAERFKQLLEVAGPDPELLIAYVDNSVMANGQVFNEEQAAMLEQALELDPHHISGLWLSGMAARQLGKPDAALRYWLTVKPLLNESPEAIEQLNTLIASVRQELGDARAQQIEEELAATSTAEATAPMQTTGSASVTLTVSLAPELRSEVKDSDTVFIFARAKSGPPMPLAASRQSVSNLPVTVTLDDSMAMMPQMSLSQFDEIVVGARISRSGQATPQPRDLESEMVETSNQASDSIELTISKRRE